MRMTQTPLSLPRWKRAFALRNATSSVAQKPQKPPRQARWGLCQCPPRSLFPQSENHAGRMSNRARTTHRTCGADAQATRDARVAAP